ncbi:MAG: Fe-S metabolism protein SufE [Halobacteriovoraceae bacterium]|nr:Fe-S metabolism protein SufE [Halobacteriovoraceae bacterium]|tara:strand:- start:9605 stop:10054 length:450 start_codon:yes stop_codon:yes gene_type:complete
MEITERISQLKQRFNQHSDWEDKYRELIKIGKESQGLPEEFQIEKYQVKGCQSQVWLRPAYQEGKINFMATSDAVLVRGIVGLITYVYSGESPQVILETESNFLKEIGITEHLSMNRTNGLASMLKQVKMYAMVYKTLADKGIMNADHL